MAEAEVAALKVALYDQHIIMNKLSAELEEEREASTSAISEALSMILRLQREKAAEKMESCQYKRMAEEKLHHADKSLEFLEEVIQQNEMEISSLMYQVETYKRKLGIDITDDEQTSSYEDQSCTGSDSLMEKTNFQGLIRRHISLPSLQLDQWCPSEMETKHDEHGLAESHGQVLKQAEEVNKKLKGFKKSKNAKIVMRRSGVATSDFLRPPSVGSAISDLESESCSWYSAGSDGSSCDSTTGDKPRKPDYKAVSCLPPQVRGSENVLKFSEPSCLEAHSNVSVHDIFEISEIHKECYPTQSCNQATEKSVHQANSIPGLPPLIPQGSMDILFLNKVLMGGHYENKLSPSRKRPLVQHGNKLVTPSKGASLGYHWTLGDPIVEIGASQVDLNQLKLGLKQLGKERTVIEEDTDGSREQLTLLKNIFKQLNTIETHLKRTTSKKHSAHNDSKVASVMEAILSFSI